MKQNRLFLIVTSCFVFTFFYYITTRSPIVGDAYNYALRGQETNPFLLAWLAYNSWSGRYFSELWGFLMCAHIDLWNVLNPLFFTCIYLNIVCLVSKKEIKWVNCLLIIFLMLSIEDHIRMQTYSWIMGTTYIIPLMLSLIYFNLLKSYFISGKFNYMKIIVSSIILFYCGLTMENISAALVFAIILLIAYDYTKNKQINKGLLINLFVIIVSFSMLRLSPGANTRLAEYHPEWAAMTLAEQVVSNFGNFVIYTFTNNQVIILVFTLILSMRLLLKKKSLRKLDFLSLFVFLIAILFCLDIEFSENIFSNGMNAVAWTYFMFWVLYVIVVLSNVVKIVDNKEETIFFILVGGVSSACMVVSPIFSSRSLIYFVYFIMIAAAMIFQEMEFSRKHNNLIGTVVIGLIGVFSIRYYHIYSLVNRIQLERESIIEYYRQNPQELEAWIPRMPDYTIHSGNIEEDNTYHMNTFKEYYGLNPELTLRFYNNELGGLIDEKD